MQIESSFSNVLFDYPRPVSSFRIPTHYQANGAILVGESAFEIKYVLLSPQILHESLPPPAPHF